MTQGSSTIHTTTPKHAATNTHSTTSTQYNTLHNKIRVMLSNTNSNIQQYIYINNKSVIWVRPTGTSKITRKTAYNIIQQRTQKHYIPTDNSRVYNRKKHQHKA
jgi:hypothetical protein